MINFFHYPICPISRQIRVYLKELNLEVDIIKESYWERREEFVKINPASTVPVIIFDKEQKEDSFARQLKELYLAVKERRQSLTKGEDALEALKIVEKIYKN